MGRSRTVVDLVASTIDSLRGQSADVYSATRGTLDSTIHALRDVSFEVPRGAGLGIIGRKLLENMRHVRDSKGTVPIFVIALAVMVVGYAGVFFGRIIKAGISRQREFLADASAVQFTRQTLGIAGALKKVGGLAEGSKLERTDAEEVSHMLFGDGVGYSALFATHPPLLERIRRLDPQFDPRQYGEIAQRWSAPVDVLALDDELAMQGAAGLAAGSARTAATTDAALPSRRAEVKVSPKHVATQVGNPGDDDYLTADAIHRQIPKPLLEAAHDQASAMEVVFALLLDADPATASRQLSLIAGSAGSSAMTATEELLPKMGALHPMARLPLAAMAFPAIRRFPRSNLVDFGALLEKLIHADGKIGLFEYCLAKLVATQVTDALEPARRRCLAPAADALDQTTHAGSTDNLRIGGAEQREQGGGTALAEWAELIERDFDAAR